MSSLSRCRSCNAQVKWIRMQTGKYMPVDPYLHTMIEGAGDTVLVTEEGSVIHGTLASYEEGANASGYISHFATCPNASQHRRSR